MQLATTLLALSTAAGLALAAPLSMAADAAEWTIEGLARTCDDADATCLWTFAIDTAEEGVDATPASYTVNATEAAPASRAVGGPQVFGNYTVTSTWSGQFGEGEGFTTLSVIDYAKGLIVYPAYKDTQLPNGQVVTPDQSYPVQNIP
ncbi:OPT super [Hypoxylon texense]